MRRSDLMLLAATALCWGSSFMFIKVAIRDIDPLVVMVLRCALGAIPLWVVSILRRRRARTAATILGDARRQAPPLVALGLLTGVPLWLVGVGEHHVDSGLAGIVNASVPIWATLLAVRYDRAHRTDRRRLVGVAVGFAGVVLLALARGSIGGSSEVLGVTAVASASCMYAVGAIVTRERLAALPSVEVAAWSVTIAAATFVAPALGHLPRGDVSATAIASVLVLGLVGTFLGFLAYYELLARVGAARATMVTYLLPPLAVGYGWLLLDERVAASSLVAMGVILAGVWLGARPARTRNRTAPAALVTLAGDPPPAR